MVGAGSLSDSVVSVSVCTCLPAPGPVWSSLGLVETVSDAVSCHSQHVGAPLPLSPQGACLALRSLKNPSWGSGGGAPGKVQEARGSDGLVPLGPGRFQAHPA